MGTVSTTLMTVISIDRPQEFVEQQTPYNNHRI